MASGLADFNPSAERSVVDLDLTGASIVKPLFEAVPVAAAPSPSAAPAQDDDTDDDGVVVERTFDASPRRYTAPLPVQTRPEQPVFTNTAAAPALPADFICQGVRTRLSVSSPLSSSLCGSTGCGVRVPACFTNAP
jgi:hypothetical protein